MFEVATTPAAAFRAAHQERARAFRFGLKWLFRR
jgi:hypothetical protein